MSEIMDKTYERKPSSKKRNRSVSSKRLKPSIIDDYDSKLDKTSIQSGENYSAYDKKSWR